jgi:hypothetical protein
VHTEISHLTKHIPNSNEERTLSGISLYIVVKPTVLTTVPTPSIVLVSRIGTSISEIAIHVPSSQRIGVVVEVDVPIVRVLKRVDVVVMVVRIGFVAMAVEAALVRAIRSEPRRSRDPRVAIAWY